MLIETHYPGFFDPEIFRIQSLPSGKVNQEWKIHAWVVRIESKPDGNGLKDKAFIPYAQAQSKTRIELSLVNGLNIRSYDARIHEAEQYKPETIKIIGCK